MSNIIKKNNIINEAHFTMSLAEYRVILMGIYWVRKHKLNPVTDRIRFHVTDFIKAFNLKEHRGSHYTSLIEAMLHLTQKQMLLKRPDDLLPNKIKTTYMHWVSEASYVDDTGIVEFMFTQGVAEALMEHEATYTLYDLQLLSKLSSFYAIRLLEYVMQWRTVGKTQMYEIEDLKHRMGIGLSFPTLNGAMSVPEVTYGENKLFNRDVIGRAIKSLNKAIPDLDLKYETVKSGKSIKGGFLTFNKNSKAIIKSREARLLEEEDREDPNTFEGESREIPPEELDNDGLPRLKF